MFSQSLPTSRVPSFIRPLRPPKSAKRLARPRLFTQNSHLLLISGVSPRPQLPFLYPAVSNRCSPPVMRSQSHNQLSRLITTESKLFIKDVLWKATKYNFYGWASLLLFGVMAFGIQNEVLERRFPSPPEWTMKSRVLHRYANSEEHLGPNDTRLADWTGVGAWYRNLLERLEDPSIDGKDLRPISQEEGDVYIARLGRVGIDVSSKSEPWRRGYYTCLIGAAKASEHRDGWVSDTTRNIAFPPEVVIGPSNPRPKPVTYGMPSAPLEENCVPAFEPAEAFYMRILTTQGFNTRQRLDAALAYADWLDFKGLSSTAEEMYHWGLSIVADALPADASSIIDIKSGVIDRRATQISPNVLLATTSLAFHYARSNNLAAALPIYLSVLRARRQLPAVLPQNEPSSKSRKQSSNARVFSFLRSMIITPPYPPTPPTGDEIALRTPAAACEEAGVMAHIGEILFASSLASSSAEAAFITSRLSLVPLKSAAGQLGSQQSGLSWTRDAVDLAESTLSSAGKNDEEVRDKCSECLIVGMENWSTMVARLLEDEQHAKAGKQPKASSSWLWGSSAKFEDEGRWERESQLVDERFENVRKLLSRAADTKERKGKVATSSWSYGYETRDTV